LKKLSNKKHTIKAKKMSKKNTKKIISLTKKQIKIVKKLQKFLAASKKAPKFDMAASLKRLEGELVKLQASLKK
jgi:hypothetical protein